MAEHWKPEYLSLILSAIAIFLMVVYNVNLYLRFKNNPLKTVMGVNHVGRRAWVHAIMKDNDKKNILAVQTLRNSIMGSTLLATTAILLSSAVAAFLASSYDVKASLRSNSFIGIESSGTLIVTYLALLVGFLFAFLCYVQSVRYTNHVNFIINIPTHGQFTPDYVADVLERAANFYTIGTRAFYMTIPLVLWLFGSVALIISTIVLIPAWHWLDTAQEDNLVLHGPAHESQPLSRTSGQGPPVCHAC